MKVSSPSIPPLRFWKTLVTFSNKHRKSRDDSSRVVVTDLNAESLFWAKCLVVVVFASFAYIISLIPLESHSVGVR